MMKRNEEKVPDFDEIIFANRNKEYGAYTLRKRYKAVTSLSVLGTLAFTTIIILLLSLTTKPATGVKGKEVIIIIQPENFKPPQVNAPEVKPPKELLKKLRNTPPEVVDDTAMVTDNIPLTDALIISTENGDLNDTVTYIEPTDNIVPPEKETFVRVEEMPEYPGGNNALLQYIGRNMKYPQEAIDNNTQGRVFLKFVVTEDGSVGEIVLLKGVDPLLDQEAIRVTGTIPRFKPGKQNGVPVRVWHSLPVLFQLKQQ